MTENVPLAYETDPHVEEAAEPEQGQTGYHQTDLTADAMTRGTRAHLTVNKALVLATGAAFLSIACAVLAAKSVCSWIWGGKKKQSAETSKARTAGAAAGQTQQVRRLHTTRVALVVLTRSSQPFGLTA
jgi:hypothetical protein